MTTETATQLKPGHTLKNGALVIQHDPKAEVVLSYGLNGTDEYVTWGIDAEGNTFWGHYFPQEGFGKSAFQMAVEDFYNRCKHSNRP